MFTASLARCRVSVTTLTLASLDAHAHWFPSSDTVVCMARYVIDATTLLYLVDVDCRIDPDHQLVAPNCIRSHALELLLGEVNAGKRSDRAAMAAHERMTEIKMRLLGDRVSRRTAWRIARQNGWDSLADAEYIAVAKLQADALVTFDARLTSRAQDIVTVASVDDLLIPH